MNLIKKLLREALEEEVRDKPVFGRGGYHQLYKSMKHPDRLYKVGKEYVVNKWVSIFEKNPKYFPKVYRVFRYEAEPNYMVVEIEKLDTEIAYKELIDLVKFINLISEQYNMEELICYNFFESETYEFVFNCAKKNSNYISQLVKKWGSFLSHVIPIVESETGHSMDLHYGNVAYDKEGNLKMIDI